MGGKKNFNAKYFLKCDYGYLTSFQNFNILCYFTASLLLVDWL